MGLRRRLWAGRVVTSLFVWAAADTASQIQRQAGRPVEVRPRPIDGDMTARDGLAFTAAHLRQTAPASPPCAVTSVNLATQSRKAWGGCIGPAPNGTIHPRGELLTAETTMSDNNTPHAQLEQQPPLPEGATCCRCARRLDMTHGASWWRERWWCLPCFAKGNV